MDYLATMETLAALALALSTVALLVSVRTLGLVKANASSAHLNLLRETVKDGITLAEVASKKNMASGHKLSKTDKLRVAVEHVLERTKGHAMPMSPAQAARLIEIELHKQKGSPA